MSMAQCTSKNRTATEIRTPHNDLLTHQWLTNKRADICCGFFFVGFPGPGPGSRAPTNWRGPWARVGSLGPDLVRVLENPQNMKLKTRLAPFIGKPSIYQYIVVFFGSLGFPTDFGATANAHAPWSHPINLKRYTEFRFFTTTWKFRPQCIEHDGATDLRTWAANCCGYRSTWKHRFEIWTVTQVRTLAANTARTATAKW